MKYIYAWLLALFTNTSSVISFDVSPQINRYCRDKDRLITSEDLDEYLLVDAEIDTTILLECHYCKEKDDKLPRIWYFQDYYKSESEKEVDLGMDNNASYNRIHVTPEFSLVIKDFEANDGGIYKCHGKEGQQEEHKFNYRLEPVFSDKGNTYIEKGNLTDWQKYYEVNLAPVTLRFAVSRMKDLVQVRESGVILEVVSEWGAWGPCEKCVRNRGFRTSRANCRVKRRLDNAIFNNETSNGAKLFMTSPMIPCRSMLLENKFAAISRSTKYLPEFILEEKCKGCKKGVNMKKKDKFKYKKRYVLAEGAHLAIICPESNLGTEVVWRKDGLKLQKGVGHSFRKKDADARVLVDTFASLYLIDVSEHEEGNYTCYVDNVNMLQVKIMVISKSRLLTQAFFRHMGYLGFIFLLTSFCYCAGLVVVCRQKDKFKVKDYKEIEARENEKQKF